MYEVFLFIHGNLRWVVLVLAVLAVVKYYMGWMSKKPFSPMDKRISMFYTASLDTQLLIGLILYIFLSPVTKMAFSNMGGAMKSPVLRFWAVEHITMMVLVVIVAHVGSVVSRKAKTDTDKYKKGFIYFAISLVLILMAIPWPFREALGKGWFTGM